MELALNLAWVCVAIAGVLALGLTLSRGDAPLRASETYGRKIIAMACALVILFFVISMTDDLHDQEVLIEEKKILRITSGTGAPAHGVSARSTPANFLFVFLLASYSVSLPAVRRGMDPSEFLFAAAIDHESLCPRPPPNLLS